jgi:hypothetical protein
LRNFGLKLKTITLSAKWSMLLFNLKSQIFFLFGHHFDSPGSGSVFPIRIRGSHFYRDPDPKHFLRLSLSFACVPVKLDGKRRKDTVFAHIVGGVHFEGVRIVFSLQYKQKMKKDEPEKTKKGLRLSLSFWVRLS